MRNRVVTMLLAGVLAGALAACASSSSGLPYKPEVQPPGATVSAAYTIVGDRLRVEIEGGGRRVERAQIVMPDGALLEAQTIEYTPAASSGGSPVSIGFGIGGFSSTGGGGGVGTGVGVSTGGLVGGGGSQRGREQHRLLPARPGRAEPLARARQAPGHRSGRHPRRRAACPRPR